MSIEQMSGESYLIKLETIYFYLFYFLKIGFTLSKAVMPPNNKGPRGMEGLRTET